uniref:glucuronosyltransferase n=1 Tax=Angiostrongylus cantonensis TaxID=6313 RepID=A0A0K0DHG4_ANGCA
LMPVMDMEQKDKTGLKLTKNVIKISADPRVYETMRHEKEMLSHIWTSGNSVFGLLKATENMIKLFAYLCEGMSHDEKLMKMLENEKFDAGISEVFDICGLGIFEILKIPATIATFSGVHIDCVSKSIGEPITPAAWSTKGDRMNFFGRLENFVNVFLGNIFFTRTYDEEIKVFRAKFGQQFKGYDELISKASFVFTNSNPYLDYPRPVLHKTVPIGGIAVAVDSKNNELSKEWHDILNERNTTVFVSFGSVAKSVYMPDQYKKTLLKVFETMPETTFIWKYEEEGSTIAKHLKNVYLSTWVPQKALLADARLTVFITHGGLGSTMELAYMGKPAILESQKYKLQRCNIIELASFFQIPIFADQTRNANMFSKHGCGIVLMKHQLEHPQKLRDSLIKIFNDASFSENARLLSEILRNQPIGPKQLLVKHSEFAARFGTIPNLDPYGRHLFLFEYYLIDVLLVCVFAFLLVVFVIVKLLKKCLSLRGKTKTE